MIKEKIESLNDDDVNIILDDPEGGFIIAEILSYNGSCSIGSKNWCIAQEKGSWDQYHSDGQRSYYIYDFNSEDDNLSMISVTLTTENEYDAAHDKYDNNIINNISNILKKKGIEERLFKLNKRELLQNRLNNLSLIYNDRSELNRDGKYEIKPNRVIVDPFKTPDYGHGDFKGYNKFYKALSRPESLDIVLDKLQSLPTKIEYFNSSKMDDEYKDIEPTNYIIYVIDKFMSKDGNYDKYVKLFSNIYNKYSHKLKPETKRSIIDFLEKYGNKSREDIILQPKVYKGERLSDIQFAHALKKGYNMKPYIQQQVRNIISGNQGAGMNKSEIDYALKIGYDKLFKKYYKDYLSNWMNPIDYEDMNIIKKLNMMPELMNMVKIKGNNIPQDQLNSIEKSIYDYAIRV